MSCEYPFGDEPCWDCKGCLGEDYWNDTQLFLPGFEPSPLPPTSSTLPSALGQALRLAFEHNNLLLEMLKKRGKVAFKGTDIQENYIYETPL